MYDIVWSSIKYLATIVSHANSHCGQKTNILLWYSQKYVAWNLIVLSSIYLHACLPVQHLINEQRTCNKRKHNKYTEYKTKWLRNTTYTNRRHSHTHEYQKRKHMLFVWSCALSAVQRWNRRRRWRRRRGPVINQLAVPTASNRRSFRLYSQTRTTLTHESVLCAHADENVKIFLEAHTTRTEIRFSAAALLAKA